MSQNGWNQSTPQGYAQQQQHAYAQGPSQPVYGQRPEPAQQQQQMHSNGGLDTALGGQVQSLSRALGGGTGTFFGGLFDFSFNNLVATRVLKVLYGLWLVIAVLGMLAGAYSAVDLMFMRYTTHILEGLVQLVALPFIFAAAVVVGRMYFEVLIVVFRIAENLTDMNAKMKA